MVDMIISNWYMILAFVSVLVLVGFSVVRFLGLPTASQVEKIKQWLLQAVISAETELGSNTGRIKLSMVYDKFIQRFPTTAKFISFERFSKLVDEALIEMRKMLESNQQVKAIVNKE